MLEELADKNFIAPYDVLSAEITGQIREFYGDIALSVQAMEELGKYRERGERFKGQFAEKINAAANAQYERFTNITGTASFLDWLTLGLISGAKNRGRVMPEEPLSLTHWLDSFGTGQVWCISGGEGAKRQ